MATTVALVDIRTEPLSIDEVLAAVQTPDAGGVVVFLGAVRAVDDGRAVVALEYAAHPGAKDRLRETTEAVARRHRVLRLAVVHRTGELGIGDLAVVVAASAAHRAEAFDAARQLIDALKAAVPIWKHQRFSDGDAEWVGSP